jgi:hypothetical protein
MPRYAPAASGIRGRQRFRFRFLVLRCVDELAEVPADQFVADRDVQGTGKNAVDLQNRISGQSLFPKRPIEVVQMVRVYAVNPVPAEFRNNPPFRFRAVGAINSAL